MQTRHVAGFMTFYTFSIVRNGDDVNKIAWISTSLRVEHGDVLRLIELWIHLSLVHLERTLRCERSLTKFA